MSRAGTVTHRLPASHSATGLMFRRPRLLATLVLMLALGACTLDLRRPPAAQWSTRTALGAVHLYQRTASPLMPALGVPLQLPVLLLDQEWHQREQPQVGQDNHDAPVLRHRTRGDRFTHCLLYTSPSPRD